MQVIEQLILCAHQAIDDEVDGAVDDDEEMLDCCEAEHPAWVSG